MTTSTIYYGCDTPRPVDRYFAAGGVRRVHSPNASTLAVAGRRLDHWLDH